MASSRSKSGAKSKPSRPAAKAKPAKKSAPARGKTAVKKVAAAKAKPVKAAPPPAKKPMPPAKIVAAKPTAVAAKPTAKDAKQSNAIPKVAAKVIPKVVAKVTPRVVARPAGAAPVVKGKDKKSALTPRRGATPENVRPIGMLPPENVARATHKPAPRPVIRPAAPPPPARPSAQPKSSSEGASRVTEKDFKEFEERLLQERRRILREMGHLETTVLKVNQRDSSGDLSGYSFHMADAGTDAMEREKAFLFASAEGRVLLEIDDALRRIYRGDYGNCETCGKPIARARLEVMPQARLCISCKEKEEREQRGAM